MEEEAVDGRENSSVGSQVSGTDDQIESQLEIPDTFMDCSEKVRLNQDVKEISARIFDLQARCPLDSTENEEKVCSDDFQDNYCSFNSLPREIILNILSYFKPRELSKNIATVCKQWYELAYDPSLWRTLNFNFNPNLSSVQLCWIIRKVGSLRKLVIRNRQNLSAAEVSIFVDSSPFLQELDLGFCDNINGYMLEYLVQKCGTLERLNVEGSDSFNDGCANLLSDAKYLSHLNFSHCCISDDGLLMLVRKLTKIVSLNVDGISWISDKSVIELCNKHQHTLRELSLDGADLTDKSIEVVSQCIHLQELLISFCELLTDQSLIHIQNLKCISRLKVRKGENFSSRAMSELFSSNLLSNLVSLDLSECSELVDEGLMQIARGCGANLKKLSLCWCWHITEPGIISLVDNCGNLNLLELIGLDKIRGECFDRIPEDMPQLTFLDLSQCNKVVDDIIIDVVRRKRDLTVINYYGEEFVYRGVSSSAIEEPSSSENDKLFR